ASASGLKYSTTKLKAPAGKVTIMMKNLSPLQHDVAIKGKGVSAKGKVVGKGATSTVTATLKKGTYTFYCSVDGHAAAGMKGTLTITEALAQAVVNTPTTSRTAAALFSSAARSSSERSSSTISSIPRAPIFTGTPM